MKSNAAGRRFFFPLRSREAVGLRREESLFASVVAASLQGAILPFARLRPRAFSACNAPMPNWAL